MELAINVHQRDNNFDFLRFFAASLVIISHCFTLSGSNFEPYAWLTGYMTFGSLAVYIFFIISGFLIAKSWDENPELLLYFKKRALRIFPGLFVSILFSALIIGPIVTKLSFIDYITNENTREYIKNIFLYPMRYNLPGVFENNPYPNSVNGSLWTLPVEFLMYCFIAFSGSIKFMNNRQTIFLIVLSFLYLDVFVFTSPEDTYLVFLTVPAIPLLKCTIFFFIGSLFYLYRDQVNLNKNLFILCAILYLFSFRSERMILVSYFALPYIVLYFSYKKITLIKNFGKYGDFSYGLYIYAFPVQQTIMNYWSNIHVLTFFLFSYSISLFLSILSWNIIEKPALKLKNRSKT